MATVLLVEDDDHVRQAFLRELRDLGHTMRSAGRALDALRDVAANAPDVVVLDLGLPDLDGAEALKMLRAVSDVPVIVATARDGEPEIIRLLQSGADDYLVKPFSHAELVARLRALLRRARGRRRASLGALEVDEDAGEARLRGRRLELTRREFELLAYLVANAGRVLTRGELLDAVWGRDFVGTERTVDQHVAQLRARLGAGWIETVRGRGYRMVRPDEAP